MDPRRRCLSSRDAQIRQSMRPIRRRGGPSRPCLPSPATTNCWGFGQGDGHGQQRRATNNPNNDTHRERRTTSTPSPPCSPPDEPVQCGVPVPAIPSLWFCFVCTLAVQFASWIAAVLVSLWNWFLMACCLKMREMQFADVCSMPPVPGSVHKVFRFAGGVQLCYLILTCSALFVFV